MPAIMGILNVTPDSFSDGGTHAMVDRAIAAGATMLEGGADILDIGGESTRPGAVPVEPEEEQRRILPVIRALSRTGAVISVDTRHACTMEAALGAGAAIVNDVSGLAHDAASAGVVARHGCRVVLMHSRGTPQTMRHLCDYGDLVREVLAELRQCVDAAVAAGVSRSAIAVDPGLGFAKTAVQNLVLLQELPAFAALGLPIVVGASRKGFIGQFGGEPDPARRLPGSLAACLFAANQGASVLRVHDVPETVQALKIWRALTPAGV